MSREYVVISLDEPENEHNIDGSDARVEMRFYDDESAQRYACGEAKRNPGRRYYTLMGASTWYGGADK